MTPQGQTTDYSTNGTGHSDRRQNDTEESDPRTLTLDETFEILKNNRRRLVLHRLQETGNRSLGELADHVTAAENDVDVSDITSTQRKRVYVGLYQFHLPKMDEMGIIDFDKDRGTVRLTSRGRDLIETHEQDSAADIQWVRVTLGLTVLAFAGTILSILTATLAVSIGTLLLLTVLLGTFCVIQHRRIP